MLTFVSFRNLVPVRPTPTPPESLRGCYFKLSRNWVRAGAGAVSACRGAGEQVGLLAGVVLMGG